MPKKSKHQCKKSSTKKKKSKENEGVNSPLKVENSVPVCQQKWIRYCPVKETILDRFDEIYQIEAALAKPYHKAGNEAYLRKDYETALLQYDKALYQFSSNKEMVLEQFYSFLLGTLKSQRKSPVRLLKAFKKEIVGHILSYFYFAGKYKLDHIPRKAMAELHGNKSIVLRIKPVHHLDPEKSKNVGSSYVSAQNARRADFTYEKGDDLVIKALEALKVRSKETGTETSEFIEAVDFLKKSIFKVNKFQGNLGSRLIAQLHTGLLPFKDVASYAVVEQYVERSKFKEARNNPYFINKPYVRCCLQVSVVGVAPPGDQHDSQFLYFTVTNTSRSSFSDAFELNGIHMTLGDPDHGDKVENPPTGFASPLTVARALKIIPIVATKLKRYAFFTTEIRMGQGLVECAGPNELVDKDGLLDKDASSLRFYQKKERTRLMNARRFRAEKLGSSSMAAQIWKDWDEFAKDLEINPSDFTHAQHLAAGGDPDDRSNAVHRRVMFQEMMEAMTEDFGPNGVFRWDDEDEE